MSAPSNGIWAEIVTERIYQDKKWGGDDHDDEHGGNDWIAYMTPYLGNAARVFWTGLPYIASYRAFREAMVKVAALAVAAIQWADRRIG